MKPQDKETKGISAVRSAAPAFILTFISGALMFYGIQRTWEKRVYGKHTSDTQQSSFGPSLPRATIAGAIDQQDGSMQIQMDDRSKLIEIDRRLYCEQVALSALVRQQHEITPDKIVFIRDPRLPGNAIQQFSTVFGYAIDTGLSKIESPSRNSVIQENSPSEDDSPGEENVSEVVVRDD